MLPRSQTLVPLSLSSLFFFFFEGPYPRFPNPNSFSLPTCKFVCFVCGKLFNPLISSSQDTRIWGCLPSSKPRSKALAVWINELLYCQRRQVLLVALSLGTHSTFSEIQDYVNMFFMESLIIVSLCTRNCGGQVSRPGVAVFEWGKCWTYSSALHILLLSPQTFRCTAATVWFFLFSHALWWCS